MTNPDGQGIFESIRDRMQSMNTTEISQVDQLKASATETARSVLAHYVLAGLYGEKGQTRLQENAAISTALTLKQLSHFQLVGVTLALAGLISEFLLAQGDGTWATAVARITDPDLPLIKGGRTLHDDPLWRLEQETKGGSSS